MISRVPTRKLDELIAQFPHGIWSTRDALPRDSGVVRTERLLRAFETVRAERSPHRRGSIFMDGDTRIVENGIMITAPVGYSGQPVYWRIVAPSTLAAGHPIVLDFLLDEEGFYRDEISLIEPGMPTAMCSDLPAVGIDGILGNHEENKRSLLDEILNAPAVKRGDRIYTVDVNTGREYYLFTHMRSLGVRVPTVQEQINSELRSDHLLVKQMTKENGLESGRAWQRLHCVDLRGRSDEMHRFAVEHDELELRHRRWDDVTLDLGMMEIVSASTRRIYQAHLWARVTDGANWTATMGRYYGPDAWVEKKPTADDLMIEMHTYFPEPGLDDWSDPQFCVIGMDDPWNKMTVLTTFKTARALERYGDAPKGISSMAKTVLGAVAYLSQAPEFIVEYTPASRGPMKARDQKPWLRPVPRTLLVSAGDVKRITTPNRHGGTHASPHFHARSGGYKLLQNERYVHKRGELIYFRPTWVGDPEWEYEGAQVRLKPGSYERGA